MTGKQEQQGGLCLELEWHERCREGTITDKYNYFIQELYAFVETARGAEF